MNASEQMRSDYVTEEEFQAMTGRSSKSSFKYKLKNEFESGLLLFAKYALVLFLSYIALQFLTSIISGSQNGTNAVLYLNELQNKGYLPKVVNGQVPNKVENEKTSSNTSTIK